MTTRDLLLEIGLEEIPARFVRGAMDQLAEKIGKWLDDSRIARGEIRAYATPRRLAVKVSDVAEKQADLNEEVRGPSKKAAYDENGGWSKAAQGFARAQGVDPSELYVKEVNGAEYVYARKSSAGAETYGVLAQGLAGIIASLSFPKNMRWGDKELRFVRPIRWILALYGSEVVPFEVAGVQSGRTTRGHRFLGKDAEIPSPAEYEAKLAEQHVIVDVDKRREEIVRQLEQLSKERQWTISVKDDLLEEVLFLVETPTVLYGTFDPSFLNIPQDVLITSMREHQRYFPVLNASGQLQPYFVTVRNGNDVSLDRVARGNEKVLRARLSDAKFFYEEDQKLAIDDCLAKLETIVFHEELGTIGDKVRRIVSTADKLSQLLQADADTARRVNRAASICKFDLVTQMVYEFPELQGVMGEDYARKLGEDEAVSRAVFEHYQPRHASDDTPSSLVGAIVSIADKIDTIVGCFSIGIIPTGSQDPYALRRQAAGIVQTVLDRGLRLKLSELFDLALEVHEAGGRMKRPADDVRKDLQDFFGLRVKNVLAEQGARYDIVDAVMGAGFDDVASAVRRAAALSASAERSGFKLEVEAYNRVSNLAAKAEDPQAAVDPSLFEHAAEGALHEAWRKASASFSEAMASGREADALAALAGLSEPIAAFFEAVMVMADNPAVRRNRLALLSAISGALRMYADFHKLVL
ncbi:glycine--tRNA ligase subunit beta [Paenibacillus thermoaerophilus]|uniref:Glycine--tRNA ligase beta subunit n=1 Tax=Paenibacillus thermoaerophilus TaxID=1215385 RepID=A0ABW2UXJ5_9BACL|nr:glycine--tRNA ligase subunit beta [Paenibacillus thermoaerophilus]TMV19034.1 glycine--tRNA ligase subunit beta [Paenibacillus thermoaerophilus]